MNEEKEPLASTIDYDATFLNMRKGRVVKGRVLEITPKEIVVDIGFKSEGVIPSEEFSSLADLAVGSEVDVYLEEYENEDGRCVLSKRKAERSHGWDRVVSGLSEKDVVRGRVVRKVKGGLMLDIGVEIFLPASLAFLKGYGSLNSLLGQEIEVRIIKINPQRRNIIVSRKDILEKEKQESRGRLISELEIGQVRTGVVKNITDFGAFVNLGGIDGLLHITDMSWGRVNHPGEVVKIGDKISVKILNFDRDSMKVSLGLKQLAQNPWHDVDARFPIGSRVRGRVVNIMPYGLFVELERGIEGLVHISEMSWSKRLTNPSEVFSAGDSVEVMVLSIDKENQKISLGIRQTAENPWIGIEERYPVGMRVKGTVWNLTDFGAFVQVESGIDGLIHISDMSWTRKLAHPRELLKKGQEIEAIVLNVDQINRKLALGLKQLEEDPWLQIAAKYPPGTLIEGAVTKTATFGAFVEVEKDIEGLLHISEMNPDAAQDLAARFPVGHRIRARIIKVDAPAHKIALSVKGI